MADNYKLTFVARRSGIVYTVNIGGGTGTAIPLKPAASPFVTQEDADEDMFIPMRTTTGYLRVVDDGYTADGRTWNWKGLIPTTDTARPVTLTHEEGNTTVVDWRGFMQAQTFSGTLYGNPQEREYPIQCFLSVLGTVQVAVGTSDTNTNPYKLNNFAYLIKYIFDSITGYPLSSFSFVFQGGDDARAWLRKRFDWRNLLNISEGDASPRYNLREVLEDVCRYWGWTVRIHRQTVIFAALDDAAEPKALEMTYSELTSMAEGSASPLGTVTNMTSAITIGNIFASTEQDDYRLRGYNKAVVKADCNPASSALQFAPQSVRDMMEATGWTWVGSPDNTRVGYYTTGEIQSFGVAQNSRTLIGSVNQSYAGYCRRQIFPDEDTTSPTTMDMIVLRQPFDSSVKASLESVYEMSFQGGNLEISGSIWQGYEQIQTDDKKRCMVVRIGIGPTRATAKWLKIDSTNFPPSLVWSSTLSTIRLSFVDAPALKPVYFDQYNIAVAQNIPIPESQGLSGKVFIDFLGNEDVEGVRIGDCNFEIGDFAVSFSRDNIVLSSGSGIPDRVATKERVDSKEYSAENGSVASDEYNVNTNWASDGDIDYGYGLLLNSDGTFMKEAPYGNGTSSTRNEQPEQHLANRISAFWARARRMLSLALRSDELGDVTPRNTATVDGTTLQNIAISRDWCDDVTMINMIET